MNNEFKPSFSQEKTLLMRIGDINKIVHNYLRKEMEKVGLSSTYRPILFHLIRNNGLSQCEIVQKTLLKAPTISLTLQKMEQEGIITRKHDDGDLRTSRVFLTEKGYEMFEQFHLIASDLENRVSSHLSDNDMKQAIYVVDKILATVQEEVNNNENF